MSGEIAAILLAAGLSRRMGRCKQLLPLMEETIMAHCIGMLLGAGIKEIIVVVSPNGNEVATEARRFPVRVAVNREPDGDMASSVRAGRDVLPVDVAGVVVALCDHPLVKSSTVTQLIEPTGRPQTASSFPSMRGEKGILSFFQDQSWMSFTTP